MGMKESDLFHKVVKFRDTGESGIVVDIRNDGREIRVKYSEGDRVSDWLDVSLVIVLSD